MIEDLQQANMNTANKTRVEQLEKYLKTAVNDYSERIVTLERQVKKLTEENNQFKRVTGPTMSALHKKLDSLGTDKRKFTDLFEDPNKAKRDHSLNTASKAQGEKPTLKGNPTPNKPTDHSDANTRGGKHKPNQVPFCANNYVVIELDQQQNSDQLQKDQSNNGQRQGNKTPKKDDEIRRAVGKTAPGVVIHHIRRYGVTANRFMVQLAKEKMVNPVIENWQKSNFEGSNARKTTGEPPNTTGIIKGVPTDIDDSCICGEL